MDTEFSISSRTNIELLQRYVDMRQKLDAEANNIFSVTSMLALLEGCGDDEINLDPIALGKINETLNKNILNIWEILDDYIYLVQAMLELERLSEHG